jgi:hypothetical protein
MLGTPMLSLTTPEMMSYTIIPRVQPVSVIPIIAPIRRVCPSRPVFTKPHGIAIPFPMPMIKGIFRHKVFKMLLSKERITKEMVNMLANWPQTLMDVGALLISGGTIQGISLNSSTWIRDYR